MAAKIKQYINNSGSTLKSRAKLIAIGVNNTAVALLLKKLVITAIKIKKLPEASEVINVLKKHFPKINIDDLLKDYESLSSWL